LYTTHSALAELLQDPVAGDLGSDHGLLLNSLDVESAFCRGRGGFDAHNLNCDVVGPPRCFARSINFGMRRGEFSVVAASISSIHQTVQAISTEQ
jgi:hypothetical protein